MSIKNNLTQSIGRIKTEKSVMFLFDALVSQFLAFVLWFLPLLKITYYSSSSEHVAMPRFFEGAGFFHFLFIILMILSLFFLVKPFLFNQLDYRNRAVAAKVSSILVLLIFLLCFFNTKSNAKENMELGFDTTCRLTIGGWLFILSNISLLVTAFMVSIKTKNLPKKNKGNMVNTSEVE